MGNPKGKRASISGASGDGAPIYPCGKVASDSIVGFERIIFFLKQPGKALAVQVGFEGARGKALLSESKVPSDPSRKAASRQA